MNLILVDRAEIDKQGLVTLTDRRAAHICKVLKAEVGSCLRTGVINAAIGEAKIQKIHYKNSCSVTLQLDSTLLSPARNTKACPAKLPITLIIALPRPKVARRLVRLCTECGIAELHFINSYRVEKSFWQSPLLSEANIHQQILLGLEQSRDTQLTKVFMHKRFNPFVEDTLAALPKTQQQFVAHPYNAAIDLTDNNQLQTIDKQQPILLAIGPEGGFIPHEIDKLNQAGLVNLGFGQRIYRVETIVPLLLGKLT